MDYKSLAERIKLNGYSKPKIAIMTPEIRTVDVTVAQPKVKIENEEELGVMSRINILEE